MAVLPMGLVLGLSGSASASAQAQSAADKAVSQFKPAVATSIKPQTQLQTQVGGSAAIMPLAPGETPFPKVTPVPNIGAQQTPGQAQTIINNTQTIPPNQMLPNTTQPVDLLKMFPGLGGGQSSYGGPVPNGGAIDRGDGSISYPRGASNDGNVGFSDSDGVSGGGSCHPAVKQGLAQNFSRIHISDDQIHKLSGAHCALDEQPTDPVTCMACNLYFEVDPGDSYEGYEAVSRSVMTRAMSQGYPRTVCGVVYQYNQLAAQYSWTFERPKWNPNHILPKDTSGRRMQTIFKAVQAAFEKGPNGFTNYFAQNLMKPGKPKWKYEGSCAATLCPVEHHTFCAINANQNRSFQSYLQQEGDRLVASSAPASTASVPGGASK